MLTGLVSPLKGLPPNSHLLQGLFVKLAALIVTLEEINCTLGISLRLEGALKEFDFLGGPDHVIAPMGQHPCLLLPMFGQLFARLA